MGKRKFINQWLRHFAKDVPEKLNEFYVVAKDYSWTYIKTHEGDLCGPYFMRNAE